MDALNKKKMKRTSLGSDQSGAVDDEEKAKLKYQTLLNEYLELQKEYVSRKRKFWAAKQKRKTILAEVRFLRQRHKCLSRSQASNTDTVPLQLPNSDIESNALEGERNHPTSEAALQDYDQTLVPNSHKHDVGEGSPQVTVEKVRYTKKLKNPLIRSNEMGKRRICWPDQVTLRV